MGVQLHDCITIQAPPVFVHRSPLSLSNLPVAVKRQVWPRGARKSIGREGGCFRYESAVRRYRRGKFFAKREALVLVLPCLIEADFLPRLS